METVKYSNFDVPDSAITRLHIFKEEGKWHIDGRDPQRNYSESIWSYNTFEEAWASVSDFAMKFDNLQSNRTVNLEVI